MKKKHIVIIAVASLLLLTYFIFSGKKNENPQIEIPVSYGKLDITVKTSGELKSENSEKIFGPAGLSRIQVYNVKITDLIPEGTVVDSGDYVATLDRSEIVNRLKDLESEYEKVESKLTNTRLDTTMSLRQARDELINLEFEMEEQQIAMEQSVFEAPAVQRQAQISYEKAKRAFEQAQKNYLLKKEQAEANMREIELTLEQQARKMESLNEVMNEFLVYAPKGGMLIYEKEWGGEKRKVGSTISPWDLTVATLPDLSSLISVTYINEIDISKVKVNQSVTIGIDAFPDKTYTGFISDVANIGEQLPGSDVKVFQVLIKLSEVDSVMRPAMTTSNQILTASYDSVLYIPIEAVHEDSTAFVYKKEGFKVVKQNVVTGVTGENEVIILQGLKREDIILLSIPDNPDELERRDI